VSAFLCVVLSSVGGGLEKDRSHIREILLNCQKPFKASEINSES